MYQLNFIYHYFSTNIFLQQHYRCPFVSQKPTANHLTSTPLNQKPKANHLTFKPLHQSPKTTNRLSTSPITIHQLTPKPLPQQPTANSQQPTANSQQPIT